MEISNSLPLLDRTCRKVFYRIICQYTIFVYCVGSMWFILIENKICSNQNVIFLEKGISLAKSKSKVSPYVCY